MSGFYLCENCGERVPAEPDNRIKDDDGIARVYCKSCAEEIKATI